MSLEPICRYQGADLDWIMFARERSLQTFVELAIGRKPKIYPSYHIIGLRRRGLRMCIPYVPRAPHGAAQNRKLPALKAMAASVIHVVPCTTSSTAPPSAKPGDLPQFFSINLPGLISLTCLSVMGPAPGYPTELGTALRV